MTLPLINYNKAPCCIRKYWYAQLLVQQIITSTFSRTSHPRRHSSSYSSSYSRYNPVLDYSPGNSEKIILVVGDGDLSNGAIMSEELKQTRPGVKLIASVLESEGQHNPGKVL